MPTTRKKDIKTVYRDEEDSENEDRDFSDSGSDAVITDQESSEDDEDVSSDDDFQTNSFKTKRPISAKKTTGKRIFANSHKNKRNKQDFESAENIGVAPVLFSIKDLTDADKLLPSFLNLSESDSSDDECSKVVSKRNIQPSIVISQAKDSEDDTETKFEYKDVWSENTPENSEEIAKMTFMELEQQNSKIEETKISIQNYTIKNEINECEVKDLLALGEEEKVERHMKSKRKIARHDSDSDMEDWEEVKEVKGIPQQGLQLIVGIPDGVNRKTKKLDIEMMMKRKMNRVKKEYQVYMHKVHVLCWLGHGNYVSRILNDQHILAAALSVVPSKECYPRERVDIKYVEQITAWYKDKVTLKQDKNENKYKPKASPLKELLLKQIKSRVFSTKKYMVFVFVSMLRSLGLQCRVMFNFVTLPIKPPTSELCSLSTKSRDDKPSEKEPKGREKKHPPSKSGKRTKAKAEKIPQLDGNYDSFCETIYIMQVDGSDDNATVRTRRRKDTAANNNKKRLNNETDPQAESISPPKRSRRNLNKTSEEDNNKKENVKKNNQSKKTAKNDKTTDALNKKNIQSVKTLHKSLSVKTIPNLENDNQNLCITESTTQPRKTRSKVVKKTSSDSQELNSKTNVKSSVKKTSKLHEKVVSEENNGVSSKYFEDNNVFVEKCEQSKRKRSLTLEPKISKNQDSNQTVKKMRTRSAHNATDNKSKYFNKESSRVPKKQDNGSEDKKRVSHKDLAMKKAKPENDVTGDLINIIKGRVKTAKEEAKKGIVKEKIKQDSDDDSDHLPVEEIKGEKSESDEDFKPSKLSPKIVPRVKKIDRRVLSTEDDLPSRKIDVWCEVFVEELEEWVAVDIIKGKVHCVNEIYSCSTHPVNYVVGWDNNNYLKDLTRKYVPHWNTVTRKQRVEPLWWDQALKAWIGPKSARDREEDERLDRLQLEAPLPKSIAEYKNHPLYALKRHLLKFEAIYPPDAATLGFVRNEAVYARDCVYVCRSRDTWVKEAKVVRLGEQPYKIVKARPKWDKLSNKLITDKPLEVFGPWQLQDYEPPVAENGVVPRNPYGNVELFKDCMLPIGTVHIKLPGLNRVAKKLNIDCASAMTGFDFNGGWSHPVYDGFVVCKEFETIITEAWLKDQEEQERREIEKTEVRVYGNWRKLIRGLFIKERLKAKYGFEEPSTSQDKNKKGPRLVVKKK